MAEPQNDPTPSPDLLYDFDVPPDLGESPDVGELIDKVCLELRAHSAALELPGDFPEEVADLLSRSGLTALCLPRRYGGRGGRLRDLVTAVERVATVDAASAWCLFIMGTAPWLLCHATPELVAEVYARPDTRIGGALAPTGTVRRGDDGYVVEGRWAFGSGVNSCQWVAVHAVFADEPVPRSAFVVVPTSEIAYREPWDGLGLASSGSGLFAVDALTVPAHRVVSSLSGPPAWPDLVFRMSFRATFAACAAVPLGIATEMLTTFTDHARSKRPTFGNGLLADQPHAQALVAESWGTVHAARALLYQSVDRLEEACADGTPSVRHQAELRIAMNTVRAGCLRVVDRLHLAAGGGAAKRESRFARLLCDAHTASQHAMFGAELTALSGAVLLGRDVPEGLL
ncbi:acyl-CoA dehydrogenase family protein [Streptomyces sp. WI04-05B]|uniref:acyl-CoA dehydrogenase family protein n=1 Tax=Streptomyces TaxID=1883 RepID=UPI0029BB9CF1|nr:MULTISPECIES: acyl-CoA dehydrogenase family protein [unclassified Streptomyces]MDX2547630.1 acyl-CoA dehydrogenase family protein [Streptomyces sp. WI04-05B]MDX2590114.1 acyl-CoA dehydrogenase family protein [Streptomyces sp. WI04-05A]MDX3752850.1 acyl-CoA dehydrogenase family protein [Streptomyces sp. AK08-02]